MSTNMKFWLCLTVVVAVAGLARADNKGADDQVIAGPAFSESALTQTLRSLTNEAQLRRVDEEALGHAREFAGGEHAASPGPGPNGTVEYVFDSTVTRIFCVPWRMCDVKLQEGENVQDFLSANQTEFVFARGVAAGAVHVAITPKVADKATSVGIYTDRRVYFLEIVATNDETKHTPRVSFTYPEDRKAQWQTRMQEEGRLASPEQTAKDEVLLRPEHLYFGYEIEKEGRWRVRRKINWTPIRAFDDGEKTYIEMPRSMLSGEAPILLVVNAEGKAAVVNYALKGTHFIVGRLFREAILVKGVGRKQELVRISREED